MTHHFNRKLSSLLDKKNTGKKTQREDNELGYSDFTLPLIFNLPHPIKKSAIVPNAIKIKEIGW